MAEDNDADLAAAIAASLSQRASQSEQMPQSAPQLRSQGMAAQTLDVEHAEQDTQAGRDAGSLPPAASSYNCELSVRLPDGKRAIEHFDRGKPLAHVVDWLATRGWDMQHHRLCTMCPRVPLVHHDLTLQQCGLQTAREALMLERVCLDRLDQ
jgi:UBX domain